MFYVLLDYYKGMNSDNFVQEYSNTNLTSQDFAIQEIIDQYIESISKKNIVPTREVIDFLLDLRLTLETNKELAQFS